MLSDKREGRKWTCPMVAGAAVEICVGKRKMVCSCNAFAMSLGKAPEAINAFTSVHRHSQFLQSIQSKHSACEQNFSGDSSFSRDATRAELQAETSSSNAKMEVALTCAPHVTQTTSSAYKRRCISRSHAA